MRFDLHVHSAHSRDGTASPRDIVRRCLQLGLDGFAVTDHNALAGSFEAFAQGRADGLVVVRGVEVSTAEGHVLAYGVREPVPTGLSVAETVERVRSSGGVPVAAHPKRFPSGIGLEAAESSGFDGVEVLNGGSSARANRAALALARTIGVSQTGGSDAHRLEEVGRSWTVLEAASTEDQVLDAISRGAARAGGRSRTVAEGIVYSVETFTGWMSGGLRRL